MPTDAPRRLCLWSGPRNVSTALLYSFAQRADTRAVDEPLYAHYLRVSGADHPGRDAVLAVWRGATHREERYAAIDLAQRPRDRAFDRAASLPMYEEIIVDGAWWDLVDPIASHHRGVHARGLLMRIRC